MRGERGTAMASLRPFARPIVTALVATALAAGIAGADPLDSEDPDDLTVGTESLDSLHHTDGSALDSVDHGSAESLDQADTGSTVGLDAADTGSDVDLDAADTGHTVSLDAAESVDAGPAGH
jgi:hypothetical protein